MGEESEDKGFRVTDKRRRAAAPVDEAPAEPAVDEVGPDAHVLGDGSGIHVGPKTDIDDAIDFGNFILGLAHNALFSMGVVEHPELGAAAKDLVSAQQMIRILEMLQHKTRGNLVEEEEQLLNGILYELRMAFVAASSTEE